MSLWYPKRQFPPLPHAGTHLKGGSDEVLNLTNINDAIGFSVESHASRHLKGGADEVLNLTNINNAVGFSLEAHGSRHNIGGVDEIPDLASHASRHLAGGADELFNQNLNTSDSPTFAGLTLTGKQIIKMSTPIVELQDQATGGKTLQIKLDTTNWWHIYNVTDSKLLFKVSDVGNGYFAGNLDVDGIGNLNSLQIGGTEVLTSGRVLQNVSIDRGTTNLPHSKVLEDVAEHTVSWLGLGWYDEKVKDTYVHSGLGYKQVRIIYKAKCSAGLGWRVILKDDDGNELYHKEGTNTTYSTFDSGWIDFVASTNKLHVWLGASSDNETEETAYIDETRIFCR